MALVRLFFCRCRSEYFWPTSVDHLFQSTSPTIFLANFCQGYFLADIVWSFFGQHRMMMLFRLHRLMLFIGRCRLGFFRSTLVGAIFLAIFRVFWSTSTDDVFQSTSADAIFWRMLARFFFADFDGGYANVVQSLFD